jgi:hypothetical protein
VPPEPASGTIAVTTACHPGVQPIQQLRGSSELTPAITPGRFLPST